ncbi:hypothetical protein NE237_002775 [Protea cynaroides]|uniref:t-SNARE coiled-coil homology domain-containing protein n=1 Tax=Protea cynaroides TaxID=273540 RepID=A0A9Q0KG45_9MAGN|nr:hypothetical protein NE237_002775 [Protea cynaroides]
MDSDMVTVLRKAKIIKGRLESLDQSNKANCNISVAYGEGSPVDRTRILVTNGLRTKLREMMNNFQTLREKIASDHREVLKRRYFNSTGEVPSDELIEKKMQETLKQIQKSLTEFHQVFLDMTVMVETQGEKMENIKQNLARTGDYIKGGTNHLINANKMKRGRKRWLYWV